MAGTTGLEPATSAVTGQRSNQLSYVPRVKFSGLSAAFGAALDNFLMVAGLGVEVNLGLTAWPCWILALELPGAGPVGAFFGVVAEAGVDAGVVFDEAAEEPE